jgi:hypothetical protein
MYKRIIDRPCFFSSSACSPHTCENEKSPAPAAATEVDLKNARRVTRSRLTVT